MHSPRRCVAKLVGAATACVIVFCVLLGTAASAAAAAPQRTVRGLLAYVVDDSVLYPESPDGWRCHLLQSCRPTAQRVAGDPAPIDTLYRNQRAKIVCAFGAYAMIGVGPDLDTFGWAPVADLDWYDTDTPATCGLDEWAWNWHPF